MSDRLKESLNQIRGAIAEMRSRSKSCESARTVNEWTNVLFPNNTSSSRQTRVSHAIRALLDEGSMERVQVTREGIDGITRTIWAYRRKGAKVGKSRRNQA